VGTGPALYITISNDGSSKDYTHKESQITVQKDGYATPSVSEPAATASPPPAVLCRDVCTQVPVEAPKDGCRLKLKWDLKCDDKVPVKKCTPKCTKECTQVCKQVEKVVPPPPAQPQQPVAEPAKAVVIAKQVPVPVQTTEAPKVLQVAALGEAVATVTVDEQLAELKEAKVAVTVPVAVLAPEPVPKVAEPVAVLKQVVAVPENPAVIVTVQKQVVTAPAFER